MNCSHIAGPTLALDDLIRNSAVDLASEAFSFIPGWFLFQAMNIDSDQWQQFANSWDQLTLDKYMGDQGRYRYRRYGEFAYCSQNRVFKPMPHKPYMQPLIVNPLNGGIARHFDPLESSFVESQVLNGVLHMMVNIFNRIVATPSDWNVRLHPYRILGSTEKAGKPTPEGLHRDGVTYIASLLIARHNVFGGRTSLTSNDTTPLTSLELKYPMDLLISDDAKTLHEVSEISPQDERSPAYRDVLVIAFTRKEIKQEPATAQENTYER